MPPPGAHRVDGNGVSFAQLPYYVGPLGYFRRVRSIAKALGTAVQDVDALILRVPSQLAVQAAAAAARIGRVYGVEVVGDPLDVFAKGAIHHPLRPLLRWWFYRSLRRLCERATAAAYVSKHLREKYPPRQTAFSTVYSSIELKPEMIASSPRSGRTTGHFRLITVASLEQPYKGVDVLIQAVARCINTGLSLELVVIGEGRFARDLKQLAKDHGVADVVKFRGSCSHADVLAELDASHLFVLPSRTEGLPRSMIEALSRGIPAVGTNVGGIPELLPPVDMVLPNDPAALARLIEVVLGDAERQFEMSKRGLEVAKTYLDSILGERREHFLQYLRAHVSEEV